MSSSAPNATSMYDVFRLHELKSRLSYKFESVATLNDLFFLGTSEGKIIVYQVTKSESTNTFDCTSIHIQTNSKSKLPVKQMVPIPEKNLLVVLIGEQIVLHSLNVVDKPGGPQKALDQLPGDKMPEIGPVRGAKDIIAFHIKKDRGVFYLAAILKKKVMVFELRDSGMIREFVVIREGLALPDGIRTVTWSGRGLLLGFRKEYVMMDITNGNIDSLFGTGRSNQPIVANLDPIQEMLIGEESAGIRVTLEGEPTAKSGLVWASLPSCMMFSYPYLLSIHDGNSIEVRNPLLLTSTLADQRQSALNTLCQTLNIKYVDRISSKGYVDFDMQRPNAQTDPLALRRDILVATNGASCVFLLEMIDVKEQALNLAASKNFEMSIDLCRLCPNEVPQATINDIKVKYGIWCFGQRRFGEATTKFNEGGADPKFVVSLFPDFLPTYVAKIWKSPSYAGTRAGGLDSRELSECVDDALGALLAYLLPLRQPPEEEEYLLMPNKPTDEEGMTQATIDTAILRSLVLLKKEEALVDFLTRPNSCVLEDIEFFMKVHRQWTPLIAFWRGRGLHEDSLALLHTLGVCGSAQPGSDYRPQLFGQNCLQNSTPVVELVDDVIAHDGLPQNEMTQEDIERRLAVVLQDRDKDPSTIPESDYNKVVCQLVGVIGCLYYLRHLDMNKNGEKILFSEYCGWLLANVDPYYSLTMFTKSVISKHDHSDVVKTLNNVGEDGKISANVRVCHYLEMIMGNKCNDIDDKDLHNERLRALIQLVMADRQPNDTTVPMSQKKLQSFLATSQFYDPIMAVQWLTGPKEYAKSFFRERALVYRRLKQHADAIGMYLNEVGSLDEAKQYATEVAHEDGDAFQVLLMNLMKPDPNGGVRIREALDVIHHCDGVDARSALPMLPGDTPLAALKGFLSKSLRQSQSKHHSTEVLASVLKQRWQQSRAAAVRVKTRFATIDVDTVCAECNKKIRPDTVFARFPNGVVVHQACLENEHVCPHTHKDFRTGIETIFYK